MGCLPQQHDLGVADARDQSVQMGGFDGVKRLAAIGDRLYQHFVGCSFERPRWRCCSIGRSPSLLANERHESDIRQVFGAVFAFRNSRDANEFLYFWIASHRDHEPPADLKLLLQGVGDLWTTSGDDNTVIRRMIRPAPGSIAMKDVDVGITEISEGGCRLFGQLADTLNRVHVVGDLGEDGGRVPEPVPISRTFSPPSSAKASVMKATI